MTEEDESTRLKNQSNAKGLKGVRLPLGPERQHATTFLLLRSLLELGTRCVALQLSTFLIRREGAERKVLNKCGTLKDSIKAHERILL